MLRECVGFDGEKRMRVEMGKVLSSALARGYQVAPEVFDFLATLDDADAEKLLENAIERKRSDSDFLLRKEDFETVFSNSTDVVVDGLRAEELEEKIEIVSDPTDEISPVEAESGFKKLFESRYYRLLEISKKRPDMKSLASTESVRAMGERQRIRIAGLLSSRHSRKGVVEVVVDDPSGSVRVVCLDEASSSATKIALDSMVIVEGSKSKGVFYGDSVILPDIPSRKPTGSVHRVYALLLSDLHIGSKMFLADDFARLIMWLNGKLGDSDIVNRVKYVLIAGDVVDGVGVYPGQEYQLAEKDMEKQYQIASQLIGGIPDAIRVIISPGNHDPVRQALPQPAISTDLARTLYGMKNVTLLGNPACVKLHGVTFLMYHGRSLDDIIATVPELSYNRPAAAMQVLLRARHLAPIYGKRTALSPEVKDMLVIDPVPDVFHAGHVHTIDSLEYRGTLLVNSGTWQSQTPFQANMGLEPTPSIVPIVDLSNLQITKRSFTREAFN